MKQCMEHKVIYEENTCPVCEAQAEINRHEISNEKLREVVRLAVESQGWSGNDPDDERWRNFYTKARTALKGEP